MENEKILPKSGSSGSLLKTTTSALPGGMLPSAKVWPKSVLDEKKRFQPFRGNKAADAVVVALDMAQD